MWKQTNTLVLGAELPLEFRLGLLRPLAHLLFPYGFWLVSPTHPPHEQLGTGTSSTFVNYEIIAIHPPFEAHKSLVPLGPFTSCSFLHNHLLLYLRLFFVASPFLLVESASFRKTKLFGCFGITSQSQILKHPRGETERRNAGVLLCFAHNLK